MAVVCIQQGKALPGKVAARLGVATTGEQDCRLQTAPRSQSGKTLLEDRKLPGRVALVTNTSFLAFLNYSLWGAGEGMLLYTEVCSFHGVRPGCESRYLSCSSSPTTCPSVKPHSSQAGEESEVR